MAGELSFRLEDIAKRENSYLSNYFSLDNLAGWNSMGLNNIKNTQSLNNGGGFNNSLTKALGSNWSTPVTGAIGTGLALYGGWQAYRTYKSMTYDDFKNESALAQIDISRDEAKQTLLEENTKMQQEAEDYISYNSYAQAMENAQNQGFNETAYTNSIFNVKRQVEQKNTTMVKNLEKLDFNAEAAKNAEVIKQKQEYLSYKLSAANALNQSWNNYIGNISTYFSQIASIPALNKNKGDFEVKADTSSVDNFFNAATTQYNTVESQMRMLDVIGINNTQSWMAQGNKIMLGQFEVYQNKKFAQTGGLGTKTSVPDLSQVYFDFDNN